MAWCSRRPQHGPALWSTNTYVASQNFSGKARTCPLTSSSRRLAQSAIHLRRHGNRGTSPSIGRPAATLVDLGQTAVSLLPQPPGRRTSRRRPMPHQHRVGTGQLSRPGDTWRCPPGVWEASRPPVTSTGKTFDLHVQHQGPHLPQGRRSNELLRPRTAEAELERLAAWGTSRPTNCPAHPRASSATGSARLEFAVPDVYCGSLHLDAIEQGSSPGRWPWSALGAGQPLAAPRPRLVRLRSTACRRGRSWLRRARIRRLGYRISMCDPADASDEAGDQALIDELVRALAVAGFAAGNIMLFSVSIWSGAECGDARRLFHWISAMLACAGIVYSGPHLLPARPGGVCAWARPTWTCRSRSA